MSAHREVVVNVILWIGAQVASLALFMEHTFGIVLALNLNGSIELMKVAIPLSCSILTTLMFYLVNYRKVHTGIRVLFRRKK